MIGKHNENLVVVDDVKYPGLLDIHSLDNLLDIEGSSGVSVPYIGYVEVNLKIPEVKAYNEDVLMMVMNDSRYGDIIPFAIGTIHTHSALEVITDNEWKNLSLAWKSAALLAYASKAAKMENFSLDTVKGDVKAHKAIILPPFSTTFVKGRSTMKDHHKRINVVTDHSNNIRNNSIAAVRSYSFIKPGSNKVVVSVKNLTIKDVTLKAGTVIGKNEVANAVPPMLATKPENREELRESTDLNVNSNLEQLSGKGQSTTILNLNSSTIPTEKCKLTQDEIDLLMGKLDLTGINDWSSEKQKEVKDLIIEYGSLFASNDMDLGRTDKVKHSIKLDNYTPFKERYRHIPPQQYIKWRQHLKEMLEIGAISKSKSPWASGVVLVRKKVVP